MNYNFSLKGLIILGFLVTFSTASAKTYFVAPDGDDNNPGTKELPWGTWGKAFNANLSPGDTVYFRGGVYFKDLSEGQSNWYYPDRDKQKGTGYTISNDGTKENYIHYYAYPPDFENGNGPILDCKEAYNTSSSLNYGIRSGNVNYVKFFGLEIRNVNYWDVDVPVECIGWLIDGTGTIIENCTVHNVSGIGFSVYEGYDFHYINCDAYNCYDPQHPSGPGEAGSGFSNHNFVTRDGSVYYENCRAWKCSDQGFSSGSWSYIEHNGCWSFHNGAITGFDNNAARGHGFKLGWGDPHLTGNPDLRRRVTNCISAFNRASGITTNDQNYLAHGMEIFNNTVYHNGYYSDWNTPVSGFVLYNTTSADRLELGRVLKNNISFDNEYNALHIGTGALFTSENNSWNAPPARTITEADFVSLDSTGLAAPRQPDGSLPDIDFLKLSPKSSLIDAGTNVGLAYSGNAPDLGAIEYKIKSSNTLPSVKISSPANNTKSASPANFDFTISASDIDGTIENVTLLKDGKTIGTKSSPPWSFNWYNVDAGTYNIVAVATDDKGASASSPPLTLVVEDKPELISNEDQLDLSDSEAIEVYPNPNNGIFTLSYNDPLQSEYTNINISTIDGRSVYKGNISKEEVTKQFNLSHISSGLYILVLYGKNIITTKKFIKN